jgi:hypothetical protein
MMLGRPAHHPGTSHHGKRATPPQGHPVALQEGKRTARRHEPAHSTVQSSPVREKGEAAGAPPCSRSPRQPRQESRAGRSRAGPAGGHAAGRSSGMGSAPARVAGIAALSADAVARVPAAARGGMRPTSPHNGTPSPKKAHHASSGLKRTMPLCPSHGLWPATEGGLDWGSPWPHCTQGRRRAGGRASTRRRRPAWGVKNPAGRFGKRVTAGLRGGTENRVCARGPLPDRGGGDASTECQGTHAAGACGCACGRACA